MARARTLNDVPMTDEQIRSVSDPVWRMLTGAFSFALGVFVCGSVGSYVPADPSWNAATSVDPQNLFGAAGAVFADMARQSFGWSAWTAGLASMIGGAMRTVLIGQPKLYRWCLGVLFVPLSAACFAAWPVPASWPLSAGLGGVVGDGLLWLAVFPFRALMLPVPDILAGLVLGAAALWCASTAMGFGRRDAELLQLAASVQSRKAASGARAVNDFFGRILARTRRVERSIVVNQDRDDDALEYIPLSNKAEPASETAPVYRDLPEESVPAPSQPAQNPIRRLMPYPPKTRIH